MKEVLAQFSAVFVCFACLRVALVAESLVSRRWALRMVSAVKSLRDFESNGFRTDGPDLVFLDWLVSGVITFLTCSRVVCFGFPCLKKQPTLTCSS